MVVLRLENYFNLFLLILGSMELFTFLGKTCLVVKVLYINFCLFFIDIVFFMEKKNIGYFSDFIYKNLYYGLLFVCWGNFFNNFLF